MLLKNVKTKTVVFLLFMGIGLTLQAQSEAPKVQMAVFPSREPLKLWLTLVKPETSKAGRIELVGARNQRLYVGMLSKKKQQFTQLFNLSEVNDGLYTLRVITPTDTVEKSFYLQSPTVQPQTLQRSVLLVSTVNKSATVQ